LALTPLAGGEQAVSARDQSGRQALEQFFLLRAYLSSATGTELSGVHNGRSAWIRVQLPPRPLAERAWQAMRQFFQRRYQL
jgi:hypothetical protein